MSPTCENCGESFETPAQFRGHACCARCHDRGSDGRQSAETPSEQCRPPSIHLEAVCELVRNLLVGSPGYSTRGAEQTACDVIAEFPWYASAWFGRTAESGDTVDACYGAGLPDARLDRLRSQSVSAVEDGLVEEANRTERVRIRRQAGPDPSPEPGDAGDPATTIAVPIHTGTHTDGVLVITAVEEAPADEPIREAFQPIGWVLGLTIRVQRQQELLFGEKRIELELRFPESDRFFAALTRDLNCRCIHVGDELTADGGVIHHHRIQGADPDEVVSAATDSDDVTAHEVRSVDDEGVRLESSTTGSFVPVCLDFGGHLRRGVVEDGTPRLTIELPQSIRVRNFVDVLEQRYDTIELISKRKLHTGSASLTSPREGHQLEEILTTEQRNAVEAAFRRGYYEWPREETAQAIAEAMGVTPPTFHRHRRTAERNILENLLVAERISS